jgi:F420H(2)-dependent quinone reductase
MSAANKDAVSRKALSPMLAKLAGIKWVVKLLGRLNVVFYRVSGGRLANQIDGTPVCLATFTRRKSGTVTTIALMYVPHGDKVLLVASLGGSNVHPAWYHSIKANPNVRIQVGTQIRSMRAHEATPDERAVLWPVAVKHFRSYALYQQKTQRVIPILVCEPAA